MNTKQAWWHMPLVQDLRGRFQASQGYLVRPCLKTNQPTNKPLKPEQQQNGTSPTVWQSVLQKLSLPQHTLEHTQCVALVYVGLAQLVCKFLQGRVGVLFLGLSSVRD